MNYFTLRVKTLFQVGFLYLSKPVHSYETIVSLLVNYRVYGCSRLIDRLWMTQPQCVTIQMKAIEQYFHVVLFIMLYKVVLTFKSVDETLVCDHSNESY